MKFKEIKAEDFCDSVRDGTHASPKKTSSGKKLITSKHIKENGLDLENAYYISEKDYQEINNRSLVEKNDILYSMIGTIGLIHRVKDNPNYAIKNMGLFKLKDELKSKWLYYYLKTPFMRNYINSLLSGSTQQYITLNNLRNLTIKVPEKLEDFQRIIKILDTIEEKIVQNSETNNNLYDMSKLLYKQWFIDFEFPNEYGKPYKSSGGKMINSELGMIPENWEIGFIDDGKLTKIIKSGVTKFEKSKKYIATADVEGTAIKSFSFVDFNSKPSRANMTPIPNSVWFAKMQDSIKNMMVANYMTDILDNYIFSTGFMGVECLKNSIFYIWNYINSDVFTSLKNNLSTGTLMAGISNTTIVGCKYVIPTETTLSLFNNEIQKLNESIYNNEQENIVLVKLRDTLLPKLMNGEINLENIGI